VLSVENYSKYFEIKERFTTKEKFVCCKDNTPKLIKDLVFKIHHLDCLDSLPNDWIYLQIFEALRFFEENAEDRAEDWSALIFDIEADVATYDLIEWSKNPYARIWLDEAITDIDLCIETFTGLLDQAQVKCKRYIYREVIDFLEEQEREEEQI